MGGKPTRRGYQDNDWAAYKVLRAGKDVEL